MAGPLETIRQNIAANNMASPVGTEEVAARTGSYRGEQVIATSGASKLTQAVKLTGLTAQAHLNLKTLDQRTLRLGQASHQFKAAARIADYYEKLPNMPDAAALQNLVELFEVYERWVSKHDEEEVDAEREGGEGEGEGTGDATKQNILAALQAFDPDVTHQFAALDLAREYFAGQEADPKFQALLDQAAGEFEKADIAQDVRAGFAAARIAQAAAATLETDPALVRDTYRSLLREQQNFGQLFDSFAKFDLLKKFDAVIDTFVETAGKDLASTGPSTDPIFLGLLLTELGKLKKLKSIFEMVKDLLFKIVRLLSNDPNFNFCFCDWLTGMKSRGSKAVHLDPPVRKSGNRLLESAGAEQAKPCAQPANNCFLLPRNKRALLDLTLDGNPPDALRVASQVLNFAAKSTVNLADARNIMSGFERLAPAGQVIFANSIRELHGLIPDGVVPSSQARLQQVTTLGVLLNNLVTAEEAHFEASTGKSKKGAS